MLSKKLKRVFVCFMVMLFFAMLPTSVVFANDEDGVGELLDCPLLEEAIAKLNDAVILGGGPAIVTVTDDYGNEVTVEVEITPIDVVLPRNWWWQDEFRTLFPGHWHLRMAFTGGSWGHIEISQFVTIEPSWINPGRHLMTPTSGWVRAWPPAGRDVLGTSFTLLSGLGPSVFVEVMGRSYLGNHGGAMSAGYEMILTINEHGFGGNFWLRAQLRRIWG